MGNKFARNKNTSAIYTIEYTTNTIYNLLTESGIDFSSKNQEQILEKGFDILAVLDDIARHKTVNRFMDHLNARKKNPSGMMNSCNFFHQICKEYLEDWKQRTQRNYPRRKWRKPELPIGTTKRRGAWFPEENTPQIETFVEGEHKETVKYLFTNHQNTNKPVAMIGYDKTVYDPLVDAFNSLQTNRLFKDYRYPIKERLESQYERAKQKRHLYGEWYCRYCWYLNEAVDWRSNVNWKNLCCGNTNCTKIRDDADGTFIQKVYDLYGIKKYDELEYNEWEIRIENVIDPLLNSEQWLMPSVFHIDTKYRVYIQSEIHNLCRKKYGNVYTLIEAVFEKMIPMFEYILGDVSFKNKDVEVIVGVQDYQLMPGQTFQGVLHREGYTEEMIEGVGIYYFDISDEIDEDIFSFHTTIYGCGREYLPEKVYDEDVKIKNGTMLVFNNKDINHRLRVLHNKSKIKKSSRKILTFFLPEFRIKHKTKKIVNNINGIGKQYHNVVAHWIRLSDVQCLDYYLVELVILYIDNIVDLIRERDELRKSRIVPELTGECLLWLPPAN